MVAEVTAAGVDTWKPTWYVDPDGLAGAWFRENATVRSAQGAWVLPEAIAGHRVGWHPAAGLMFAEGHPGGRGELCLPDELTVRCLDLQDALRAADVPVPTRGRGFESLGPSSEGWAGLGRVDGTVNLRMGSQAEGLAVLAGIAACVRDQPGKSQVIWGSQRAVETVYVLGHAGRRKLGRWYDKSVEAAVESALAGPRGTVIRGEDQRRWGKGARRDPWEMTAGYTRELWQRRFYPLWKASKGVRVSGPIVAAQRLIEAVADGQITSQRARMLAGDVVFEALGEPVGRRSARYESQRERRELGIVLADGVLDEVEVEIGAVLEAALETDAWERRG